MVVVGLDIGQVRIGVAVSDETASLASPRGFIRRRSDASAIEAIVRVVAESKAELVVIGLPVSLDGQLHAQAQRVQRFAEKLRARLPVPLVYADETLSTVHAEEALRAAGVRSERLRERIDAAAAAVILQAYLDQQQRPASSEQHERRSAASLSEPSADVDAPAESWQSDPPERMYP